MSLPTTALSAWLCDFAALSTMFLAAALAARWLLRSPAERMVMAWSTWLGLAALAIVTALPGWPRIALLTNRLAPARSEMRLAPDADAVWVDASQLSVERDDLSSNGQNEQQVHFAALMQPTQSPWRSIIVLAWLATSGIALGWIALGLTQTWRLLAQSTAAPKWIAHELQRIVGKRKSPGLRLSARLSSAAAMGAIRPRILLPEASAGESFATAVQAALAHEWAHIRRGDLWLLALERLLMPLVAWHPLFWLLRRGVRLDQELLADAEAAGERPIEYAEALVAWAKTAQPAPAGLALLSLWESPHTLSRRITMLLDPRHPASASVSRGWQGLLVASLIALVSGLSLLSFRPLTADEPPADPTLAANSDDDAAPSVPAAKTQIVLKCTIIDVPAEELSKILPEVNTQPQPSPALAVVVRSPTRWREALGKFQDDSRTNVISRPQIQTLDGQDAWVQMTAAVPWVVAEQTRVGFTLQVTPRLLPRKDEQQSIQIRVSGEQSDVDNVTDALQPRVKTVRSFSTTAFVPVGETLIIADRSPVPGHERSIEVPLAHARAVLLVALEPQLVSEITDPTTKTTLAESKPQPLPEAKPQSNPRPLPKASAAEPSPDFSKLFQGPLDDEAKLKAYLLRQVETLRQSRETDANRLKAARSEFDARFAQLQAFTQVLEQYNRDRAKDSDETGLLKRQLTDLRMQIDRLLGQYQAASSPAGGQPVVVRPLDPKENRLTRAVHIMHASANDVARALQEVAAEYPPPGVSIAVNAGTIVIEGPATTVAALQKVVAVLDRPATAPPRTAAYPQSPRPANVPAAVQHPVQNPLAQRPVEVPSAQVPTPYATYPQPARPPREEAHANSDRETQAKLLAIDLADAKLEAEEAEEELATARSARQSQAYKRSTDGEVTLPDNAAVRQAERRVERAKNHLRRIQVQLEGLKQPAPSAR